jgi:degradative hydroxymethylglutaryl-CoA reductase
MVHRGGGVKSVETKVVRLAAEDIARVSGITALREMLVVEISVDVCDAMGANSVNNICEKMAPEIEIITGGRIGLKIMSNLCLQRRAGASFKIPISRLSIGKVEGVEFAKRILEAYYFAKGDIIRATTHNKGIMNGIGAVALATGQDWRAVEASAHAFASLGGYKPLTEYSVQQDGQLGPCLHGSIEIPISVGTKGGAIYSNPLYIQNMEILRNPSSKQLAEIMVSVGLAQNFGALKALVIEGIQKGHMKLHARNIAISAGVPVEHIDEAVQYLIQRDDISVNAAREFIVKNRDKCSNLF